MNVIGSELGTWIRCAVPEDAPGIATVHVSSWQFAYSGFLSESVIQSYTVSKREKYWRRFIADSKNWTVFLLDSNSGVKGVASVIAARDDELHQTATSELAALYLDRSVCGKGVGFEMLRHCWGEARTRKYTTMVLWVLECNERALRFYRKHGFERDGAKKYHARLELKEIRLRVALSEIESDG